MALTAKEVDDVIEKVASLVGGEDRGLFAWVLRLAADQAENTDQFSMLAIKMLEKTYGVRA
jgi:hypothetical protein